MLGHVEVSEIIKGYPTPKQLQKKTPISLLKSQLSLKGHGRDWILRGIWSLNFWAFGCAVLVRVLVFKRWKPSYILRHLWSSLCSYWYHDIAWIYHAPWKCSTPPCPPCFKLYDAVCCLCFGDALSCILSTFHPGATCCTHCIITVHIFWIGRITKSITNFISNELTFLVLFQGCRFGPFHQAALPWFHQYFDPAWFHLCIGDKSGTLFFAFFGASHVTKSPHNN